MKRTRRDSTTFGVDTVEPGNPDIASQLREAFAVAQRFPVDVSTTIVPVAIVHRSVETSAGGYGGVMIGASPQAYAGAVVAGLINVGARRIVIRELYIGPGAIDCLVAVQELTDIAGISDVEYSAPMARGPISSRMFTALAAAIAPPPAVGVSQVNRYQVDGQLYLNTNEDYSRSRLPAEGITIFPGEALTVIPNTSSKYVQLQVSFDEFA